MRGITSLMLLGVVGGFAGAPQEVDKDLVGWWKFDDAKDSVAAADSSGRKNDGKLVDGPKWGDDGGKGILEFDGKGGHVEIPNSESLENLQEGSYTMVAWFKPADTPAGAADEDNNGWYSILCKTGWHEGLRYGRENKFVMEHWVAGTEADKPVWSGTGTWEETFDAGKWYHVAGVVDRAAGETRLFVNGASRATSEPWTPNGAAREYDKVTWKIGHAAPGAKQWAWPAKGAIDDVRLYKRALTGDEIQKLFAAGR